MAIAFVQQQAQGNTVSATISNTALASPTTVGNCIIVATMTDNATRTVTSVKDNAGNTYRLLTRQPGTGMTFELWIATNIPATTSLVATATFSAISSGNMAIVGEYSGLTSVLIDQYLIATTSATTTPSIGPMQTTTYPNELLIAVIWESSTGTTATAGAGYSNALVTAGSGWHAAIESRIVSSTGAYSAGFTCDATIAYQILLVGIFQGPGVGDSLYNHILVGNGMSRSEVAN